MKKNLLLALFLSFIPLSAMADNNTSELIAQLTPYLNKVESCIAYYSNMDKTNQLEHSLALLPDKFSLVGGNCGSGHKVSVFDESISWDIPGYEVKNPNITQFMVMNNGLVRVTLRFQKDGSDLLLVPYFKESGSYKVEWLIGEASACIKDKVCSGRTDTEELKLAMQHEKIRYENLLQLLNEQKNKLYIKTVQHENVLHQEWMSWINSHLMNIDVENLEKEHSKQQPEFSKYLFAYKALANDLEQRITAITPLSSDNLSDILSQGIYQYEKLADRLDYEITNSSGMLQYKHAVNNLFSRDGVERNIDTKLHNKLLEVMFYSIKHDAINLLAEKKVIDEAQQFMFEANNLLNFVSDEKLNKYRSNNNIDASISDDDVIKQITEKQSNDRRVNSSDKNVYKNFIQHTKNYMGMLEMLYADTDKALYLQPQINYVIDICNNDSSCYIRYNAEVIDKLSSLKTDMIKVFGSRFASALNAYDEKWQKFVKKIAMAKKQKGVNLFVHTLASNVIEYNLLLGTIKTIESSGVGLAKNTVLIR